MYYRNCVIENCTKSAHWERICVVCKKHVCDGHIGYHSRTCIKCMEDQAIQEQKDRKKAAGEREKENRKERIQESKKKKLINKIELQSRRNRTKENKKLERLAKKIEKQKKLELELEKKSDIEIYFEISFFRKLNLHRIRRPKK